MPQDTGDLEEIIAKMLRHGARQVTTRNLFEEAVLVWHVSEERPLSHTCIKLEEFMLSAARNCKAAIDVIERIDSSGAHDRDLFTALKKYVEDTCEAIKVVDDDLKRYGSSIAELIPELPSESDHDVATWRNLIGRRVVIAHKLLTVDNQRIYQEAVRDFKPLYQLLSYVCFVPVKTDFGNEQIGLSPMIRTKWIEGLTPANAGEHPKIGTALTFICDDESLGFVAIRMGISDQRELLVSSSQKMNLPISIHALHDEPSNREARS